VFAYVCPNQSKGLIMASATECGDTTEGTAGCSSTVAPITDASRAGPQYTWFGEVKDGKLSVWLVERGSDGRGKPRVEMRVYGARYPYSLSAAEARELGLALIAGADGLEVK
jgi:hypothetical protein